MQSKGLYAIRKSGSRIFLSKSTFLKKMNNDKRFAKYLIYFVILFPVLFYPIGVDFTIFLLGGRSVLEGGKIYVDYIDIKPPFVYYLFALIYFVCGNSQFLIQLFNFALYFATALLISKIVARVTQDEKLAFITPIPYLFLLHSFNHHNLMELESLFNLVFLLLLHQVLFAKKIKLKFILIGLLVAISFSLKYVLGIMLLAVVFVEWKKNNIRDNISNFLILMFSFFFSSLLLFLPIIVDKDILSGFLRVVDYLAFYYQLVVDRSNTFKYVLDTVGGFFGIHFSIAFLFAGSIGIWKVLKSFQFGGAYNSSLIVLNRRFHSFFLISFVLLSISIILENKYFGYHNLRLLPILSVYVGIGVIEIYDNLRKFSPRLRRLIIVILTTIFIFLSPFPRFVNHLIPIPYYFFDWNKYVDYYDNKNSNFDKLAQVLKIKDFINPQLKESDTVMLIGEIPTINMYLRNKHFSAFAFPVFYLSPYRIPREWEKVLFDELNNSRFIIVQRNDAFHFYQYRASTLESLQWKSEYYNIILDRFRNVLETPDFIIYKRSD